MDINTLIDDIMSIKKSLQKHTNDYLYDSEFTALIDEQLNSRIMLLTQFLKEKKLESYLSSFNYLGNTVCGNAIQFVDLTDSLKKNILECSEWSLPQKRLKLINSLADYMQKTYKFNEIDIIFNSLDIKCGIGLFSSSSKKEYVQKVLTNVAIDKLLYLAKSENVIDNLIDITDSVNILSNDSINEQIDKCVSKINNGDYNGAITNSRTLLEEVLLSIEEKITGNRETNDGDLPKLYKRVRKKINLDPDNSEIDNSLKQITVGIASIVNGFSNVSNNAGDRHATTYKPGKRHALLTVNTTFAICSFLIQTYDYQYNH